MKWQGVSRRAYKSFRGLIQIIGAAQWEGNIDAGKLTAQCAIDRSKVAALLIST
jgi:hypothetical protein